MLKCFHLGYLFVIYDDDGVSANDDDLELSDNCVHADEKQAIEGPMRHFASVDNSQYFLLLLRVDEQS